MKFLYPIKLLIPAISLSLLGGISCLNAQEVEHHGHPELIEDAALSIADVVASALTNQPRWNEAETRRAQDDAWSDVAEGFIAGQPQLSVNYLDDVAFNDIGEREYQGGVSFPVWWPGQRKSASALATAMSRETDDWTKALAWSVAGEVRSLLAAIDLAETRLAAAELAVSDAESLLKLTESMFSAGDIAQADVMLARGRVLEYRSLQIEAEADVVDAYREYNVFSGLNTVPASGLDEMMAPDAAINFDHPLLAEYDAGLKRARQQTEQQRLGSRGNPTLSVGARNVRADQFTDANTTLALSLSIPFGGKRFTSAKVADARRAETDIEVALLEMQRELQTQLHEVEHDLQVTRQKITIAAESASLAQSHWDMTRTAWELGENTMTEVMIAQQQYRETNLKLLTLQLQQKALVSAFNQTLGVMP